MYDVEETRTDKQLQLRLANKLRPFKMTFVSNSAFQEDEFELWRNCLQRFKINLPANDAVEAKKSALDGYRQYKYTEAELNQTIEEKRKRGALHQVGIFYIKGHLAVFK